MGLDLTRDLASVYTTITRDIHYSRYHVINVLTEAAPDDPQGGTVRLCTIIDGWKLAVPRQPPKVGEAQEYLTVACYDDVPGRQYLQPAGQPAQPLMQLLTRATQFELHDTRDGGRTRYAGAETAPRPRTATRKYRQAVVMSETEQTPWHDPAP